MRCLLMLLLMSIVGCHGPLTKPMIDRLDEKGQAKIDEVWENMLIPPDALDRTLLLDVILSAQLYQHGVDSLRLTSEKAVGEGLVVMEIRFDREEPLFDEFSVSYVDRRGRELRRERYSRDEINEEIDLMIQDRRDSHHALNAEDEVAEELGDHEAMRKERMQAIHEVLEPMQRSDDDSEELIQQE